MENEQVKQKFPIGMILILILVGWGALGLLLGMFKIPLSQLGPVLVSGAGSIIVNLIIFGILATIFYGIIKRLKWARKLAIGWYVFSMVLLPINLISFLANKTMYDSYYQKLLPPETLALMTPAVITGTLISTLVFGWIIGIIIIIYLARKKDFFVNWFFLAFCKRIYLQRKTWNYQRCGSAAFQNFRGGTSSPPQAAKAVRTIFRILHHVGNCKFERFASLRSATNS